MDYMYYSGSGVRTPKRRVTCTLITTDGTTMQGSFFCGGNQRVKDLLNGDYLFVAFETLDGEIHLINRQQIARVMPESATAQARAAA